MADKTLVIKEPTADEVRKVTVHYVDGAPAMIDVEVAERARDGSTPDVWHTVSVPFSDMSAGAAGRLASIVADTLTTVRERLGFIPPRVIPSGAGNGNGGGR